MCRKFVLTLAQNITTAIPTPITTTTPLLPLKLMSSAPRVCVALVRSKSKLNSVERQRKLLAKQTERKSDNRVRLLAPRTL